MARLSLLAVVALAAVVTVDAAYAAKVVTLTDANFDATVRDGVWIIDLYAVSAPALRLAGPRAAALSHTFCAALVRALQAPGTDPGRSGARDCATCPDRRAAGVERASWAACVC